MRLFTRSGTLNDASSRSGDLDLKRRAVLGGDPLQILMQLLLEPDVDHDGFGFGRQASIPQAFDGPRVK
jgi:hypothetical protein